MDFSDIPCYLRRQPPHTADMNPVLQKSTLMQMRIKILSGFLGHRPSKTLISLLHCGKTYTARRMCFYLGPRLGHSFKQDKMLPRADTENNRALAI